MIAKIGRSANLYGALAYNNLKVEKENGQILFTNKIIETSDGQYSVAQLAQSFAPYLLANQNTEKHTLHISLNPDPKDKVSDDTYREMAQQYMKELGYGDQPFVVFKHTDIDRSHIHIVSVCVDENGKKIPDKFEKVRSMNICRELEKQYNLIPATDKERQHNDKIFKPVDYKGRRHKKSDCFGSTTFAELLSISDFGRIQCFAIPVQYYHRENRGRIAGKNAKRFIVYSIK